MTIKEILRAKGIKITNLRKLEDGKYRASVKDGKWRFEDAQLILKDGHLVMRDSDGNHLNTIQVPEEKSSSLYT